MIFLNTVTVKGPFWTQKICNKHFWIKSDPSEFPTSPGKGGSRHGYKLLQLKRDIFFPSLPKVSQEVLTYLKNCHKKWQICEPNFLEQSSYLFPSSMRGGHLNWKNYWEGLSSSPSSLRGWYLTKRYWVGLSALSRSLPVIPPNLIFTFHEQHQHQFHKTILIIIIVIIITIIIYHHHHITIIINSIPTKGGGIFPKSWRWDEPVEDKLRRRPKNFANNKKKRHQKTQQVLQIHVHRNFGEKELRQFTFIITLRNDIPPPRET